MQGMLDETDVEDDDSIISYICFNIYFVIAAIRSHFMNKHLQKTVENYKENKDIMSWNPRRPNCSQK